MDKVRVQEPVSGASRTPIDIAYPYADELRLHIKVGACRLRVVPGESDQWVVGTYDDPSSSRPVRITTEGGTVKIWQEQVNWNPLEWLDNIPTFDLAIGKTRAFQLTLETGASENTLDLGGVPITSFDINAGAGALAIDFPVPNPVEMSRLRLHSGAGSVDLRELANANFAEMSVEGGASGYKFDFGGQLRRDADVKITTGVSGIDLFIPAYTAARVTNQAVLGGMEVHGAFVRQDGAVFTRPALAGGYPQLTVHASITLGGLNLHLT